MAKPIVLSFGGKTSSLAFKKLDRSKLYGKRRRIALDKAGETCARAELTQDGSLLIRSGMTAQGYFDESNQQVSTRDLVGLDEAGEPVESIKTTLGVEVEAKVAEPSELLDMALKSVYLAEPEEVDPELQAALDEGSILRFNFSYRGGYVNHDAAFLVKNDAGLFVLVGGMSEAPWCELEVPAGPDLADEDDDDDDDLDFEMF